MTITAGHKSIIDYSSFDILAGETVRFIQPDAKSKVLNRVFGDLPSTIDGDLFANGRVYIVNPYGIHLGPKARISVGGLVAAAGTISDRDFLNSRDHFQNLKGDVVNAGRVEGSSVILAGQHAVNSGTIHVKKGLVAMTAGNDVFIGQNGERVYVKVGAGPANGDSAGVENSGKIEATEGRSVLAAGDLYSLAVVNTGEIQSRRVTLEGQGSGLVQVNGTIDASSSSPGTTGGDIEVLGERVAVKGATLDASGPAGGGSILVGGDLRGGGTARTADRTLVDSDSTLRADATESGNGGKIVVWSDELTLFSGRVSARGGPNGGNGGFAEISSRLTLGADGVVDLGASRGKVGTLLYDPLDIEIRGSADDSGGDGSDDSDFRDDLLHHEDNLPGQVATLDESLFEQGGPAVPFVIYESEIEGTDANIVLEARRSIQVSGAFNNTDLQIMRDRNLTLRTRNSVQDVSEGNQQEDGIAPGIDLTASIHGDDLVIRTSGSGNVTLESNTDGTSSGNIRVGMVQTGLRGHLSITADDGNVFLREDSTENEPTASIIAGRIDISGNSVTMGQNQKMVAINGSLRIEAKDVATVGDLGATGALVVDAGDSIRLLNREPVEGRTGDAGLDFVGDTIRFNVGEEGSIRLVNEGNQFVGFGSPRNVEVRDFLAEIFVQTPVVERAGDGYLDFLAGAERPEPPTEVLPLVEPFPDLGGLPEVIVTDGFIVEGGRTMPPNTIETEDLEGLALLKALESLGIHPRAASRDELHSSLRGQGLYRQEIRTETPKPEQFQVVERRFTRESARRAIAAYRKLFGGGPNNPDRSQTVVEAIQRAHVRYRQTTPNPDPVDFRLDLERRLRTGDALAVTVLDYFEEYRNVLSRVAELGLTVPEQANATFSLFSRVTTLGLSALDLYRAASPTPAELQDKLNSKPE